MGFIIAIYIVLFFFAIFFLLIFVMLQYRNRKELYSNPQPTKFPKVSFLVSAFNEQESIGETLRSLLDVNYPEGKKEIIVINDGSTDGTSKIVKKFLKEYREIVLLEKKNSGKARSLNEGMKIAKGELIAVVDADSFPNKDALLKMVGHFEDENVAAVTSRVLVKNKVNWLCKKQVADYSIIAWTRKLLDFVNSVYVTNGPLSIYRRDLAIKVGGFDPYNLTEDIEITWNFLSKGYNTRMSYSAIVYTVVPEDFRTWVKQRVRWNLGGLQTVQKYWRSMFKRREFGYFVIPYVAASFFFAILGFFLLLRFFWIKGSYYYFSAFYYFQGYDFFKYIDFDLNFTLLLFLSMSFLVMAIFYYKVGLKHSEKQKRSVGSIVSYAFLYRSLYIIPLLIALYKLARRDIRWYTK